MLKMENQLPNFFKNKLIKQYGEDGYKKILNGYIEQRVVTLRVNILKSHLESVCEELSKNNIEFEKVTWSDVALVIKNATEEDIQKLSIYENGEIYLQSLFS